MLSYLFKFLLISITVSAVYSNYFKSARDAHRLQTTSLSDLRALANQDGSTYIDKVLNNILIPRVVGTANHEKVFKYIIKELRRLKWHVSVDEFDAKVPIFGKLRFKNIISTPNPSAERFLTLACHYDSKYFKNVVFVGATDSAVPCAMMLEIAKSLSQDLSSTSQLSLKLLFLDGEEAFENWGPNDSIYGAKHLAKQLDLNKTRIAGNALVSELEKIDVFILLDLIGTKNPVFLNFFDDTQRWFVRMAQIEYDLHNANLLKNHRNTYFQFTQPYGRIEDDHLPFQKKGVPILHLITTPFPREWHTPKDNKDIIDMDSVYNMNLILKVFITEYLHLKNETDILEKTSNVIEEPSNLIQEHVEQISVKYAKVDTHLSPQYVIYEPLGLFDILCITTTL